MQDTGDEIDIDNELWGTQWQAEYEQQLAQDIDSLDGDVLDLESESILIRAERIMPLTAVILDAMVRYEYTHETVLGYLLRLFRIQD